MGKGDDENVKKRYFDTTQSQESQMNIAERNNLKSILKSNDSHKSWKKFPGDKLKCGGCFTCGQQGHRSRDCPSGGDGDKKRGSCYKCSQEGHMARDCPNEDSNKRSDNCFNCGKRGHVSRYCTKPKNNENILPCFNCGEEGHRSRECSKPGGGGYPRKCFKCNEEGHMSRECLNSKNSGGREGDSRKCFKCNEEGHMSRECPNSEDGGSGGVKCYRCNEMGHISKDCRNPESTKKLGPNASAIKKENLRKKQQKKGRIIVRNLSFKIEENDLKKIFSEYGNVNDIKIPKKTDGKKRGFAIVQFDKIKSALKAVKNLNFKEIKGRPVAIDFLLPKDKYESVKSSKIQNDNCVSTENKSSPDAEESSDDDDENSTSESLPDEEVNRPPLSDKDKKVEEFLKEFKFETNSDEETGDKISDDSDSSDEEHDEASDSDNKDVMDENLLHEQKKSSAIKKEPANDVQEGRTVFIRNIPFNADQESFKDAMEEFGPVEYCLLCIDHLTELPRGTAFAKFKNKEDADKLVAKSSEEAGNGVFFEHRKLHCVLAVSRDEIKQRMDSGTKERKDKRNLRLLREGLIMANSEEAKGISEADMKKRNRLEAVKNQKLRNLNFFVSDTRLCIHNLPLDYTDKKLRQLFKEAVSEKNIITEARIMKEMQKVDADGEARSKGFGFVSFAQPEHALEALHKLNNNPSIFSDQKRPIVEFAIESHIALLSQQRRREKSKQRNSKRTETKFANEKQQLTEQTSKITNKQKRKRKQDKLTNQQHQSNELLHQNKKLKQNDDTLQQAPTGSSKEKKLKNKVKERNVQAAEDKKFSELVNQYKDKLLIKYKS